MSEEKRSSMEPARRYRVQLKIKTDSAQACFVLDPGPARISQNSEGFRPIFQNRVADWLTDSPYFRVLDIPSRGYLYVGTGSGNPLWSCLDESGISKEARAMNYELAILLGVIGA